MERCTLPADTLASLRDTGSVGDEGIATVRNRAAEGLIQVLGVTLGHRERVDSDSNQVDDESGETKVTWSRLYRDTDLDSFQEIPYVITDDSDTESSPDSSPTPESRLYVPLDSDIDPWLEIEESRISVTVLRSDDEVFQRVADIVDTEYLSDSTATIVGLGTIGSTVAVELAKSGIGELYLYDPDILEVHNVSRHVCDLPDVGRLKVAAVADRVRRRNPGITVHEYPVDILDSRADLRDGTRGSDVVLSCTDTQVSQAVVNEEAVAARVPAIFAGAWERGYGGQIIRTHPAEGGPCYACILGTPDPMDQAARNDDGTIDYSQARDAQEADFAAEPGISVDIGFLSLLQVRYILGTLLSDRNLPVSELPADTLVWGNRGEDPFEHPFESHWRNQERDPECPICSEGGLAETLRENLLTGEETMNSDLDDLEEIDTEELDMDLEFDGGDDPMSSG